MMAGRIGTRERWPGRVAALGVGVVLALFCAQVDVYLDRRGALPVPSSAVFLVCVAGLLAAVTRWERRAAAFWRSRRAGVARQLLPLLVLGALTLLGVSRPGAYGGANARYFLLMTYGAVVFLATVLLGMSTPARRWWRATARLGLLILVATIVWDAVVPGSFSSEIARGAGTAVNANDAALFATAMLAVALRYDRVRAGDLALLAVGTIGVFATLSRGGVALLLVVQAFYLTRTLVWPLLTGARKARRSLLLVIAAVAFLGSALTVLVRTSPMFEDLSARQRLDIFTGRARVVDPQEKRLSLVREYTDRIAERPLLGHGPGYVNTRPRGPHNMFLRLWVELGVLGPVAYLAWLLGLAHLFLRRGRISGLALVAVVLLASLVSHNITEFRVLLIALGMEAGGALAGTGPRGAPA